MRHPLFKLLLELLLTSAVGLGGALLCVLHVHWAAGAILSLLTVLVYIWLTVGYVKRQNLSRSRTVLLCALSPATWLTLLLAILWLCGYLFATNQMPMVLKPLV